LGHFYKDIADSLLAGRSGVRAITGFNASEHPSRIGGQVENIPCPPGWSDSAFRQLPRLDQLTLWCCSQALIDSGWWERRTDLRIGIVLGISAEWLELWEADALAGGKRVFHPEQDSES